MERKFYQKTGFKNTVLISIPTIISALGIIISLIKNSVIIAILIFAIIVLLIFLICSVVFYGNKDDEIVNRMQYLQERNDYLTSILAHMENDYKTVTSEVSAFSQIIEKWSATINSFANNIKMNGYISDKAWNKVKITDTICMTTKSIIQQYCNDYTNANISVGYIAYIKDENNEEWVHMISHSNSASIRPNACKNRVKLSECKYHYGDLIRDKYNQYIAIPLYCKSGKLLGIFQIVTKYGCIIESDRSKMRQFITDIIIPFSSLIVLADKIYKGLYIDPIQINKEV